MIKVNPFHIRNYFAGNSLDRASHLRVDGAEVRRLVAHPTARFLPFWRRRHLLARSDSNAEQPSLVRLALTQMGLGTADLPRFYWVFLGNDAAGPVFGIDISAVEDAPARIPCGDEAFVELRPFEFFLSADDAALISQFRGMVSWRTTHRFCGVCGLPTVADQAGHHLVCENGHEQFPRTDPVAVILVHHQDRVLLAKGTRFPDKRLMSALSGFVEPGESIEETAVRETFEEVGVRARSVRYHSSQPWPFPGIVMMGFRIEAENMDLTIDAQEIAEARWFTRGDVSNHEALGFEPPNPKTLAGQLLKSWMAV